MCNPRRIRVRATRELCEAWEREVARTIELQETVRGEARLRQSLDGTLPGPVLHTLEAVLAAAGSGWTAVPEGYRYDVEGGCVTYLSEERALEIVAYREDQVVAVGRADRRLQGLLSTEIEAEGEGLTYDDGWGGLTEEVATRNAQAAAEEKLEGERRKRLEDEGNQAEAQIGAELEAQARESGEQQLHRTAEERRAELAVQAREHMEAVGVRGRQAFHQALTSAYRDAILAYARQNQAENLQCNESGEFVEIEFSLRG